VVWLDNFSKNYAVAMQGISSGAYAACQWTGQGIHEYIGASINELVTPTSGMPDSVFSDDINKLLIAQLKKVDDRGSALFNESLCVKHNVCRIPLKPQVDPDIHPRLHQVLSESRDGLTNFHPIKITDKDIGSNRGLLFILKDLEQRHAKNPTKMMFVTVDCNIYWRMMKVKSEL